MSTLDVPCDGRVSFHRLNARGMSELLLGDEIRRPSPRTPQSLALLYFAAPLIATYLRPMAYLERGIGA